MKDLHTKEMVGKTYIIIYPKRYIDIYKLDSRIINLDMNLKTGSCPPSLGACNNHRR